MLIYSPIMAGFAQVQSTSDRLWALKPKMPFDTTEILPDHCSRTALYNLKFCNDKFSPNCPLVNYR